MPQRLKLESFEPRAAEDEAIEIEPVAFEEAKLTAFEKGYQAGWDDAVAAQDSETARLHGDLGRNLQALSFTFHEARHHMLEALRPLLIDMTAKVLPEVARASLPALVAEQLMPLAEELASAPVTVLANPAVLPQIEEILTRDDSLPLAFTPENSLSEGQVYLRFSETETRIDLDAVITMISQAVATYFNTSAEEPRND
jgi:flagellar assembly protein FliH